MGFFSDPVQEQPPAPDAAGFHPDDDNDECLHCLALTKGPLQLLSTAAGAGSHSAMCSSCGKIVNFQGSG